MGPSISSPITLSSTPQFIHLYIYFFLFSFFSTYAQAQSPTTSAPAAAIVTSTADYNYIGCYNETTGYAAGGNVRALYPGNMVFATPCPLHTYLSALDFQQLIRFLHNRLLQTLRPSRRVFHSAFRRVNRRTEDLSMGVNGTYTNLPLPRTHIRTHAHGPVEARANCLNWTI